MSIPEVFPRTPTTAAGRALEQRLAYDRDPAHYEPGDFFIDDRRDILAIEAEARAEVTDDMTTAYMVGFENGKDEARAPLEAEIERLRRIETAARRLPAPDLDAKRRRYTIASDEPDFHALRAALEEPLYTEDDPDWSAMVSPISDTDGGHDDR